MRSLLIVNDYFQGKNNAVFGVFLQRLNINHSFTVLLSLDRKFPSITEYILLRKSYNIYTFVCIETKLIFYDL